MEKLLRRLLILVGVFVVLGIGACFSDPDLSGLPCKNDSDCLGLFCYNGHCSGRTRSDELHTERASVDGSSQDVSKAVPEQTSNEMEQSSGPETEPEPEGPAEPQEESGNETNSNEPTVQEQAKEKEPSTFQKAGVLQLGSTGDDDIRTIAVDSDNNIYITGYFGSTVTLGTKALQTGNVDTYVAKLNPQGEVLWVAQTRGNGTSLSFDMVVDPKGNIYIGGRFGGKTGQSTTFESTTLTCSGGLDIFVAKLDSQGQWQWAVRAGGDRKDLLSQIALYPDGSGVAVTGSFQDTSTFGFTTLTSNKGSPDLYIGKVSSKGSWQWAVRAGGVGEELGSDVHVDTTGAVYITGHIGSHTTFGSIALTSMGSRDLLFAKYHGDWKFAVNAGSSNDDRGIALVPYLDQYWIVGQFTGTTATFGSITMEGGHPTKKNIWVLQVQKNGRVSTTLKAVGSEHMLARDVVLDSQGNLVITGVFSGTAKFGSITVSSKGGEDIFVAKVQNTNIQFSHVLHIGGSKNDRPTSLAPYPLDHTLLLSGFITDQATIGGIPITSKGGKDGILWKLKFP